ncbi:MAG: ABC transporter permease [Acidobacteriota bacterium]
MQIKDLVRRSLVYYWRSNLAVIAGVATAVAVLAGALLVGESVRASLRQLVLNRLGATDEVISAPGFFRAGVAGDLEKHAEFQKQFRAAVPLIILEGVVTHDQTKRRAGGVLIYGIDKNFFEFHGVKESVPTANEVLISPGLAAELAAQPGETLLLRIEKPSAIPSESVHARKEDTGLTLRTDVRAILEPDSLGEFSLQPQQTAVRAIFLPIERLQRNLEQDGKANTILLARLPAPQSNEAAIAVARATLSESLALTDFGLSTRVLEAQHCLSLESDSGVISDVTADRALKSAEAVKLSASPVLTYLANTLRIGERRIPYSLVTALEHREYERLKNGRVNTERPLLLNQWAATDLQAKAGDKITLDYYVWRDEGALAVASADFQIDGIIPLEGDANDSHYAPDYPGITEAKSLADWDPPFPVDLSLVRPRDEEYWDKYRTTPKAFVLLADAAPLWSTRYGSLTSVRLFPAAGEELNVAKTAFTREMRASLNPVESGYSIYSARAEGLAASRGATDFGEYFTYFSFFIVVSALLLAALFFRLGIEQRLREIGTLRAVGFGSGSIRNLFLGEGVVLAIAGSIAGALGALAYGWLMVFGLRTWWVGAVGTTALRLHVSGWSLAIGIAGGVLAAIGCTVVTLRSLTAFSPRSLLAGSITSKPKRERASGALPGKSSASGSYYLPVSAATGAAGVVLLVAGWSKVIGEAAGFFGAGTLFLMAMIIYSAYWLRRDRRALISGHGWWAVARLGFRNATFRPGRSVLCIALIAASSFIIVSVDAFRRDASSTSFEPKSGTGGYKLIGESLVPIVHNLNSEEGRSSLNLTAESGELDGVDFARFRLRPGDDASCLNLYQPRNPRILGAPPDFSQKGRFAFQGSLATTPAERDNPWLLIDGSSADTAIPVIADANSLTYVLHLALGDETSISGGDGTAVRLRVVGALADSILQGELIMSEANFLRIFPREDGFRFFLIDAPLAQSDALSTFLEDRLADYGFDATATGSRLAGFHEVENTYLSTFQTLGGLGLLLGTIGLAAVLIRNVIERRRELALLRAVGYRSVHFATMVLGENILLLAAGLAIGFICAMVAILPALIARGGHLPYHALLLLALVLLTGLAASILAVRTAFRSPLLPALRGE